MLGPYLTDTPENLGEPLVFFLTRWLEPRGVYRGDPTELRVSWLFVGGPNTRGIKHPSDELLMQMPDGRCARRGFYQLFSG